MAVEDAPAVAVALPDVLQEISGDLPPHGLLDDQAHVRNQGFDGRASKMDASILVV
jgi:hypothetical protein